MKMKRLRVLLTVTVMAVSMLAGCGEAAQDAQQSGGAAAVGKTDTEAPQENETEAADVIAVTGGEIRGTTDENGVTAYLGIPYAASTEGENRWKAPQPVESWEGVRECTEYGLIAPQAEAVNWTGAYTEEYLISGNVESGTMSEDCLNLNVWTSAQAGANNPVIVYIHGGGNNSGAGSCDVYSGQSIAKQGVVWVSINYRLGIFGFLAYKDGSGKEVTGNYAIMDQIAALKWVQDNIAAFGGDPANVTIMGQSAGSMDVQALMMSPAAEGLFTKAAALSGYCMDWPVSTVEELQAEAAGSLSDYTIEDLRAMSMAELQGLAEGTYNPSSICIDGEIFKQSYLDAFYSGEYNKVDFLTGCVTGDSTTFAYLTLPDDDGIPFTPVLSATPEAYADALKDTFGEYADDVHALYMEEDGAEDVYFPTIDTLNIDGMIANYYFNAVLRDAKDTEHSSYIYYFSHSIPDAENALGAFGAFHTSDVSYWEDYYTTLSNKKWADYDHELGRTMSGYLVNFAKTGNPNGTDADGNPLPEWKAVDLNDDITYMNFGDEGTSLVTMDSAKSNVFKTFKESVLQLK